MSLSETIASLRFVNCELFMKQKREQKTHYNRRNEGKQLSLVIIDTKGAAQ